MSSGTDDTYETHELSGSERLKELRRLRLHLITTPGSVPCEPGRTEDLVSWNGKRESFAVLSPNSILRLRLRQRWPGYSERIAYALAQYDVADTKAVRLDSDAAVARWLTSP